MSALEVLLVDEVSSLAARLQQLLACQIQDQPHFRLSVAVGRQDAIERLALRHFDVVLMAISVDDAGLSGRLEPLVRAVQMPLVVVYSDEDGRAIEATILAQGADACFPVEVLTSDSLHRALRQSCARGTRDRLWRRAEARCAMAVEAAGLGIWDWAVADDALWCSVQARELLGLHSTAELGLDQLLAALKVEDRSRFRTALTTHLAGDTPRLEIEVETRSKSAARWVAMRGLATDAAAFGRGGRSIVGSVADVSVRHAIETQLRNDALHDALTGLPNRALLLDRLDLALKRRVRDPSARFAVLFFDLDRFKMVNDSLGHSVGDQLLVAVAQRLRSVVRPEDTVARLGGDEFALLIENLTHEAEAAQVAERLWGLIAAPMEVNGHRLRTTASIGIAIAAPVHRQPQDLLRDADLAMYRAKANADLRYAIFDEAMHASILAQHTVETDLWQALEQHQFRVAYQPILSLATGRVLSFEALLRWEHAVRGALMPSEFMGTVDETGLCLPVGWFILERVLADLAIWGHAAPREGGASVCVNVSSRFFMQSDLPERLADLMTRYRTPPGSLCLEVTEDTLLSHNVFCRERLSVLRNMGVQLYVDDFGTGYSSFSYLRQFRYDGLKIDRSFIAELGLKPETDAIIESLVHLGRSLKMTVVAEGVENGAQAERLRALGCPAAQGFWFSRPLSSTDAIAFMGRPETAADAEPGEQPAARR